ncbi:MAG: response regulator [Alphaproteobacteria bacterium]|nr:response regulator [Alphaproteobacteria bacterium]
MAIKVLVIDLDSNVLAGAQRSLASSRYDVAVARHGVEGMRSFHEWAPAVTLIEVFMPDKDGIECLLEIKRAASEAKVIAMTGGGALKQEYVLNLATKLGADGVLAKPFTPQELRSAIRSVLLPPSERD